MARCFKHNGPRPDNYVEPTAPPFSPILGPEQPEPEIKVRTWLSDLPASVHRTKAPEMSAEEMAAAEKRLGLPGMISEAFDNLSGLPEAMGIAEKIRPGEAGRCAQSKTLIGKEVVQRIAHPRSEVVFQYPARRRVGVDAPWAPDALTSHSEREAHGRYAVEFRENGLKNPVSPPQGPREEQNPDAAREEPGLRIIGRQHSRSAYPLGPGTGEIFLFTNTKGHWKPDPRPARPARPLGVYDRAEVRVYMHNQRKKAVRQLMAQRKWSPAGAREQVAALADGGKTWEMLTDEAETAEMVLQVYGKMDPPPAWGLKPWAPWPGAPLPPKKAVVKKAAAAPKEKGQPAAVLAAPVDSKEQTPEQAPSPPISDPAAHGHGDGDCAAPAASGDAGSTTSSSHSSAESAEVPGSSGRPKRTREHSARARATAENKNGAEKRGREGDEGAPSAKKQKK